MPDPGRGGGAAHGGIDAGLRDGTALLGEHERAGLRSAVLEPLAEQVLDSGVERDVPVGVQLADRDVQPLPVADGHDRVRRQAQELAFAQRGAGENLDADPVEQVGHVAGGGHQPGGVGVAGEAGQRPVADRHVPGENGTAGWGVLIAPFGDPVEEAAQVADPHPGGGPGRAGAAAVAGPGGHPGLEPFDVGAADRRDRGHAGVVCGQVAGQVPQRGAGQGDAARPHANSELGQVAAHGRGHDRDLLIECLPVPGLPAVGNPLAVGLVQDPEGGEGGGQAVQRGSERVRQTAAMRGDRGGERLASCLEPRAVQQLRRPAGGRGQLGQDAPLALGFLIIPAEGGRGGREPQGTRECQKFCVRG